MQPPDTAQSSGPLLIPRVRLAAHLVWIILAIFAVIMGASNNKAFMISNIQATARAWIEKDLIFRLWAAKHGGVYVPISADTQPNPWLNLPERDISTPSGQRLTLMNPAYMSRQIFEISQSQPDFPQGHITSLNPVRPENAPDPWEFQALKTFESGRAEYGEFITVNGKAVYRYMRPLTTEKPCLKCHAGQGYREGMVRGGISVTIPATEYEQAMIHGNSSHVAIITVIWLIGATSIFFGFRRINAGATALTTERDNLDAVFNATPMPLLLFDEQLEVVRVNRAFRNDCLDYDILPDRRCGTLLKCVNAHSHPMGCGASTACDSCKLIGALRESLRSRTPLRGEAPVSQFDPDGNRSEVWLIYCAEAVTLNGANHVLLSFMEITQRKRMEELLEQRAAQLEDEVAERQAAQETLQEQTAQLEKEIAVRAQTEAMLLHAQKMESIGTLAGGVAHDFNNLLAVIGGYAQLLQLSVKGNEQQRMCIQEISDSVNRGAELTRSLLTFSGKHEPQMRRDDLNQIVANLKKSMSRLLRSDVTLTFDLSLERLPVFADRVQIEQVLINLLVNARDAVTSGGSILVSTRSAEIREEQVTNGVAVLPGLYGITTVTDNGNGMDEETLTRIFEPFFTTKEIGKGTGLGLSIAFGIAGNHNGRITVQSTPGHGATFELYLPLFQGDMPSEPTAEPEETEFYGNETLLLVDDEPNVLMMTQKILQQYGYCVLTAVDGINALEVFEAHQDEIRVAILDMIMPRMNGRAVVEEIRRNHPELPIILSSGYSDDIIDCSVLDAMNATFLQKPVHARTLLETIRSKLEREA